MSTMAAILELLDSAINAAAKTASDLEEVRRQLIAHPQIDDSATGEVVREVEGDDSHSG